MPGTPDPVLGSRALTLAAAILVATLAASLPFVLRDAFDGRRGLALAGGVGYAAVCLGAWSGARIATYGFPGRTEAVWAVLLPVGAVVLFVQASLPYYAYARWGLVAPLGALFVATVLVLPAFLGVGGESDPMALYAPFFGPGLVAGTALVGFVEFAVRRLVFDGPW